MATEGLGGHAEAMDSHMTDDNVFGAALADDTRSIKSLASVSSSMFSSVRSHSTLIEHEGYVPRTKICLIGNDISTTLEAAAECFGFEVVRSVSGQEYLDDPSVVLVVNDFDERYQRLYRIKWRVLGSMAVIQCANEDVPLPVQCRPLYCFIMKDVVICFTGIRDKDLALELIFLIRSMGGSVRREPNRHITHVISMTTQGRKYEYASTFILPIMSIDWVREAWNYRNVPDVHATDDYLMVHRLKPFIEVFAAFIGFPKEELADMKVALKNNGGTYVEATCPLCTHIVVDDISPVSIPSGVNAKVALVNTKWFWQSIQEVTRARESQFVVPPERFRRPPQRGSVRRRSTGPRMMPGKENVDPSPSSSPSPYHLTKKFNRRLSLATVNSPDRTITLESPATPNTPDLFNNGTFPSPSAPLAEDDPSATCSPRRAATAFAGTPKRILSETSTPSPCSSASTRTPCDRGPSAAPPRRLSLSRRGSLASVAAPPISARFGAFLELMHTEKNYLKILDTVLQMRSDALNPAQAGGALLSQTEAKMIFGALMPISRTHHAILKDLQFIHNNWREDANVGEVFQRYSPDLLRDYTPFVSTFEDAKETLQQASERNPRFHAFLKVCRGRPECGRQELHELMIRPVQRLGSCKLLLREILKHTPASCPDRKQIENALESLSHVLSLINEDKRKMESVTKVFGVFSLVDECPAHVIASHRSLIVECEGVEVTENGFGKPGSCIAFFVFTDVVLVCKKKSKVVSMMKGLPGSDNIPRRVLKAVQGKPYKFLQLLPLSTIKKVLDVVDSDSETAANAMGLVFRGKTEMRESCSYIRLADPGENGLSKAQLLERWSCALASHNCVPDPATFIQRETAEEAGIPAASELLNKAAQMAVKTHAMVTTAFGLKKTDSMNSFKSYASSPPCVMSSFNSTSRLETMHERLGEDPDEDIQKPKPASLTANIMKRM